MSGVHTMPRINIITQIYISERTPKKINQGVYNDETEEKEEIYAVLLLELCYKFA